MVLLIDTSSAYSGVAVIDDAGRTHAERVAQSGRDFHIAETTMSLVEPDDVTAIGVATGPGSFTGLRSGVAFAIGFAMARRIPIRSLANLEITARRARTTATGVTEAGRGRLYFLPPGGEPSIGWPLDLPRDVPAVGWLRESTREAVLAAGIELVPQAGLRPFAEAALDVYGESPEVPYARVNLRYMQELERT